MNQPHYQHRAALVAAICLLLATGILPASAQGQLTISQASLRLWPEYDDPGLLVIFAGEFAEAASFPQQVTFPVAAGARNIQATMKEPDGTLLSQSDWKVESGTLIYTLPKPGFHYEYYVDRPPSGNQREMTYTFVAPYPIKALQIEVQRPARATGFTVAPAASSTAQGSDGLTYRRFTRENLAVGDTLDIVISYSKPDSVLTSPQLAVTNAGAGTGPEPATAASSARKPNEWLPYVLIGVGLGLLLGIAAYWVSARRAFAPASPVMTARSQAAALPGAHPPAGGTAAGFCTQCGNPFRPADRFCAQCGAPRKG